MSKELKVLKKLITYQCANYFPALNSKSNFCIGADKCCMYFTDSENLPRCKYLEEAVLPAEENKAALVMYKAVHEALGAGEKLSSQKVKSILAKENKSIQCEKCNDDFKPRSNRQKFCEKCRKQIQRDQARLRMQNIRQLSQGVNFTL